MVATTSAVFKVQSLTKPSDPLLTSCVPLVTKLILSTELVWPSNVRRHEPSAMAQTRTVVSPDAEAKTYK